MKKSLKKIGLKKRTVQVLNTRDQQILNAGADTAGASAGACSFRTRCFICDPPITLARRP